MSTILSVWCALCDHLAPFAAMAVAPLLLWVHHFETLPAAIQESVNTAAPDEPAHLLRDATEKGVATADALEGWAA